MTRSPQRPLMTVEFFSRYECLGIPLPDKATVCHGQCEGTGMVPVKSDDREEPFRSLWLIAEIKKPSDDGWHFIICPACNGKGLRRLVSTLSTAEGK